MRLSPSFDNTVADFSPRPSIPLEPVILGGTSVKPTPILPIILAPKKVDDIPPIHQQIDVTTFFKKTAQPKPSQPTLPHPQIKVNVIQKPKTVPKPTPTPVNKQLLVSKPPPEPLNEDKLLLSENKEAYKKVIRSVTKPQPTPIKFTPPPRKEVDNEKAAAIQNQLHYQLDNIQLSIAEELKKITPTAPPITPIPLPPTIKLPSFIQPAPQAKSSNPPLSTTEVQANPAVKIIPTNKPAQIETTSSLSTTNFWDYFLPRSNPKLNPYKSQARGQVILGVKIFGLFLLSLGIFVIGQAFVSGFSLNVIFEAISTFALAGILLFLGENLNMFFEPVNPYKIHEMT